jgi:DNA primase
VISQNTIQQILSRIDIIDIVGTFVKLKKRGTNYLGLCPFHNEKSPSFTVSPTKEIYKCFGCGKSGNSISFLMEHEKYSYVESLRWLANRYNVEVEETEVSEEVKLQQQVADSLYVINNFAQKYFSEKLMEDQRGRDIGLAYLKERGFREDIIQKFQIGYCLEERDAFARTAIANQFNRELLLRSGLVVDRDETLYDQESLRKTTVLQSISIPRKMRSTLRARSYMVLTSPGRPLIKRTNVYWLKVIQTLYRCTRLELRM